MPQPAPQPFAQHLSEVKRGDQLVLLKQVAALDLRRDAASDCQFLTIRGNDYDSN
jgi:hypothetical protein